MKLWDKGYKIMKQIEKFTVGKDPVLDMKLIPYDCRASKAHAEMLNSIGLLNDEEVKLLNEKLDEIIRLWEKNQFKIQLEDEDCHTAIEKFLTAELGDLGKKIHATRSRNDQVLTALRLYEKEQLTNIVQKIKKLINTLNEKISLSGETIFPGYTHTRQAMPATVKMWLGCYVSAMEDNIQLINFINDWIDQSPLGTAAGYGVPVFHIDRKQTAAAMGFKKVLENPIYAQLTRSKFETIILESISSIGFDLNRLSSDLIFFSMEEFQMIELPEEICTGSSIMPQKKNPDALELIRASYHCLIGEETKMKTMTANLILGYHRDIQLSKEPVMTSFETVCACLDIMDLIIEKIKVNKNKAKKMILPGIYATEEAFKLVKQGAPFREAYKIISEKLKTQ